MPEKNKPHATIKDVAKAAGVSQSTVSRVLNKTGYISEETEKRVTEAVRALEYSPSAIAVSLSKSRSRMIGAIVPHIYTNFFNDLFYVADKIAERYDYRMILCNSDSSVERERRLIEDLLSYNIAALFIVPVDSDRGNNAEYLNRIRENGVPVICVDRELPGIHCDGVYIDNYTACYEAVTEVLRMGYRNIAFMSGVPTSAPGVQRLQAFRDACRAFDLEVPDENILLSEGDSWREREAFLYSLVRRETPPKAVINLIKGWDATMLRAVTSTGLRIPQDIFLTGLDDDSALRIYGYHMSFYPESTTIATFAANLLMERTLGGKVLPEPVRNAMTTHLSAILPADLPLPLPDAEPEKN